MCSASTTRAICLSRRESTTAERAVGVSIFRRQLTCACACMRSNNTTACTGQRSMQSAAACIRANPGMHSYMHLTCCVCSRIEICSDCSGRWSAVHAISIPQCIGKALWLHACYPPWVRSPMRRVQQWQNEHCRREASRSRDCFAATTKNMTQGRLIPSKFIQCLLISAWSCKTMVVNGPLAVMSS